MSEGGNLNGISFREKLLSYFFSNQPYDTNKKQRFMTYCSGLRFKDSWYNQNDIN